MKKKKPSVWTAERVELLRRLYPDSLTADLVPVFGAGVRAIQTAAFRFGIRKTNEQRARGTAAGQFKKGHATHNKGKKWDEYLSPEIQAKMRQTQFKAKHIPFNVLPDWSEREVREGHIEIKVPGRSKWMQKHRWVWEQEHGPIPKGMLIAFRDGNSRNCDISNLEMITKEENMKRNAYYNNYPKEVASLFHLKGILTRQINKHKSNQ